MYQREIAKLPTEISREDFVEKIFDLGFDQNHEYDTIMLAVQIGDFFVKYDGHRIPHTSWKRKEIVESKLSKRDPRCDPDGIADILAIQKYSDELVHTVTAIASDYNEDDGYDIAKANVNCNNGYVFKLEWEICSILEFHIQPRNYIRAIGQLIYHKHQYEKIRHLAPIFWDLSKDICLNHQLTIMNPNTVLLGIVMLYKRKRLSAIRKYRCRRFSTLFKNLAREYELPIGKILQAYIAYKRSQ